MKLSKDIAGYISRFSEEVGKFEEDSFQCDMSAELKDFGITSPIEQILYSALCAVRKFNYFSIDEPVQSKDKYYIVGLGINPQKKIGKYRCDFEVVYGTTIRRDGTQRIYNSVIVECDSQQFHERTEQERRYEKARDRFFVSQGYKVFHYTGKEIMQKPLETAREIIAFVVDQPKEDLLKDSNI